MSRNKAKTQYGRLLEILGHYWKSYGGWKALLFSPYTHISFFLCVLMWPIWSEKDWWNVVIAIIPSIVGFSLGGYAIFSAFGDENFKRAISGVTKEDGIGATSPFIQANASFLHFIVMQLLALLFAVIARSRLYESLPWRMENWIDSFTCGKLFCFIEVVTPFLWFCGYFLFIYSLLLAFAATFAIFRMARWFDDSVTIEKKMAEGQETTGAAAAKDEEHLH